ncbi:ATP-binding protein [Amycolatopsis sp. NPDC051903]|uniref:ATP-binding protein n=1 Tax=Amycolatopsis sp. NPDC051903 TaxID=3363936 RepID=UPI00378875CA
MQALQGLPRWRRAAELIGRRAECAVLDQLISAVRSGESRALVVHGEPGVGKTALLDYVAAQALGCRVLRSNGVQVEMDLPFARLHQLCAPMLDRLDRVPGPQRAALRTAFGISEGPTPNVFHVGLAVLSLLSSVAEEQPLICVIDDHQWLDTASASALAFVARRIGGESVGLVVATRDIGADLGGLPGLPVRGLPVGESQALLETALSGPVDARIRHQIVVETGGNPLALLELPRGLTPTELAGGFGLPGAMSLSGSIEESFARRAGALPEAAKQLLLVASSEPSGDPALLWRAAAWLDIEADSITPAVEEGLVELGIRVRFRHPLVRSAVYRSASAEARQQAHRALAEATDPELDPDRRAWHRAQAVIGPDEDVAAALECSAARARMRGGFAAASAFLRRATTLTHEPSLRVARALAAAEMHLKAGALDPIPDLVAMAEAGPLSEFQRAQIDLIRAQLGFLTNRGSDSPPLLLKAARRLAPIDAALSRETYLDAVAAATYFDAGSAASNSTRPVAHLWSIARAAAAAPQAVEMRASDLLLAGTVAALTDGYAAGLPMLRRGLAEYGTGLTAGRELQRLWFTSTTAMRIWDDERWDALSSRHVQLARDLGSLSELPRALDIRTLQCVFSGDLTEAARLTHEARAIEDVTGTVLAPYGVLGVAAFRGDAAAEKHLRQTTMPGGSRAGDAVESTAAEWARAVLCNGLGRYRDALDAARRAVSFDAGPVSLLWPHVELVEAAVRGGELETAQDAYRRLAETTSAVGSDWALGIQFRSAALLTGGGEAEELYRTSISHLSRTNLRVDLARAYLVFGEWLRREQRLNEAREPLDTAYQMLDTMGVLAFAERAYREVKAAGGGVRRRVRASRHDELTAQESHIARMARDGLSNSEIAARLLISAHTVNYHLRKVFVKLGITSRSQLEAALPDEL